MRPRSWFDISAMVKTNNADELRASIQEWLQYAPHVTGHGPGVVYSLHGLYGTRVDVWVCPNCVARVSARCLGFWKDGTAKAHAGAQCFAGCGTMAKAIRLTLSLEAQAKKVGLPADYFVKRVAK